MAVRRHGGSTFPPLLRQAILWGVGAFGTLLLLGFIGYAQLLSYLQGEDFRATLEKVIVSKTGATSAEIDGTLSIDSNRVSVRGAKVQRPGMLHGLEGCGLHAELNRAALFDRELHVTRLMVEEGTFRFDAAQKGRKQQVSAAPQAASGLISQAATGFLASLAPTRARLDRFDIKDFNATFQLRGEECSLADSSLSANPAARQPKGTWEFRLSNGRVRTPLPILAESNLKAATLTVGSKVTTLSDARFMLSPGELIANAVFRNTSDDWTADVRANSLELSRLLRGESWQKRFKGDVYGRLRMDGNARGLQQAQGTLSLQQGVLEPLPFLEDIPVGNNYPYRRLTFDKATARLSYPHADEARNIRRAWLLDQIDLRAEGGWLRIQGHALVDDDGSLAGALLIGIPENVGKQIAPIGSPLLQSIFNAKGDAGYLWLRLNLSGSLSDPQEDLSARLTALMGSILPQAATSLRNLFLPAQNNRTPATEEAAPAKDDNDAPNNSPAGLLEEAGKAAGGLIGSGLRGIF